MSTKRPWKAYGRYGSVGIELVLSILIGVFVGKWIDEKYAGARGWVTIAGLVVGVYAGFRQVFRAAKQIQREAEQFERDEAAARAAFAEKAKRDSELARHEESIKTVPAPETTGPRNDDRDDRKD